MTMFVDHGPVEIILARPCPKCGSEVVLRTFGGGSRTVATCRKLCHTTNYAAKAATAVRRWEAWEAGFLAKQEADPAEQAALTARLEKLLAEFPARVQRLEKGGIIK